MSGITILIEYPWTTSYLPWLSSSYPWATIGNNEILTLSNISPTIIYGFGISVDATEELLTVSIQDTSIVEGQGISFPASADALSIETSLVPPEILFSYVIFPDSENLLVSIIKPQKTGALWEIRLTPETYWDTRVEPIEKWETRNQVLWNYRVLPWKSTFYPWLITDRVKILTWDKRTKPITTFIKRTKPITNWK